MDVGEWLRGLGLEQYEAAFREAEVGPDILADLNDADLAELGVTLGNRKRLLRAIAALGAAQAPALPGGSVQDEAERRQLTVMFCDLVGSTAISARLDPEDMRDVIRAYQDACSGAVARYDGFLARFMGDGVLAYFGFPRAHEDEAERAIRTGLDIIDAVAQLDTPAQRRLRACSSMTLTIQARAILLCSTLAGRPGRGVEDRESEHGTPSTSRLSPTPLIPPTT